MTLRDSVAALLLLLAATAVTHSDAQGPQKYYCASMCARKDLPCPSPCRPCPKVPPCPAPFCPHPVCPHFPHLHPCPEPVCAPLPKIPVCPTPTVNLSCPHVACPKHSCPACARCPDILPCPVCPTTVPPTTPTTVVPTTTSSARTTTSITTTTPTTTTVRWTNVITSVTERAISRRNITSSPTIERTSTGTTTKTTANVVVSSTSVSGPATTAMPQLTTIGTTASLPEGYVRTPGIGAFKYVGIKKTWFEANTTCGLDGGYLAIPNSKDEFDLLKRMMVSRNKEILHVGFAATSTGVFTTVLKENMTSVESTLWASGEPSGGPQYACTYLARRGLVTERCGDLEVFVCEIA